MRTFEHFPEHSTCILCGKSTDSTCILVGIDDTQDGSNEQATPVHVDCIKLRLNKHRNVVYQVCTDV
jgi:hypothetical protein